MNRNEIETARQGDYDHKGAERRSLGVLTLLGISQISIFS
jgi:hypothetical protein